MEKRSFTVKSVFDHALEIESDAEREIYLDEVCANAREIRFKVEGLLKAYYQVGDFLEQPAAAIVATLVKDDSPAVQVGSQIGPYKLMEQLGEGGMGIVYVAKQEKPVRRKVALKIIKPGMDTKQVIARFEAERQALALMDHPNIAKVHDAGATETGRPYFIMELVRGIPITEYCDKKKLPPRERLDLFIQVCRAVQHAHQKGIIHRDLKPTNILVTLIDAKPVPKVIDFGVAKATNQQLTELTLYTSYNQMIGTPMYMSPEQAEMTSQDVDTRSDVYSLGVLLYELLSGTTPFDKETLKDAGFDEMRRIIREDEPLPPSVRISTLKAEQITTLSSQRSLDERKLIHSLRGELDWIVMKALEKDRNRRYESASAFAEDLERYLNDEAVQACPPSTIYRFKKFVHRNTVVLTTSLLVATALLVGTGVSIWQAREAIQARDDADGQRKRAEANVQLALDALEQVYLPLAESEFSEKIELTERDREFLEKTLPFYEKLAAQKGDDPQTQFAKARAYLRVGNIYRTLHTRPEENAQQAEHALRQAIVLFEEMVAKFPDKPEYQRDLATSYRNLGELLHVKQPEKAEQLYRKAIAIYKTVVDKLSASDRLGLPFTQYLLAIRLRSKWSSFQEAEFYFRESLASCENMLASYPDDLQFQYRLARVWKELGQLLIKTRRLKQGEDAFRKSIAAFEKLISGAPDRQYGRPGLVDSLKVLGDLLLNTGRGKEAEQVLLRALNLLEKEGRHWKSSRDYHPMALSNMILRTYARVLEQKSHFDAAEKNYRKALELGKQLTQEFPHYDTYSGLLRHSRNSLASFLIRMGRRTDAQNLAMDIPVPQTATDYVQRGKFYKHIKIFDKAFSDFHTAVDLEPDNAEHHDRLCRHYTYCPDSRLGNLQLAIEYGRKAIELEPNNASYHTGLAHIFRLQGNPQAARKECAQALKLEPTQCESFRLLATICLDEGNFEDALSHAQKAVNFAPHGDHPHSFRARGDVYVKLNRYEEALADYNIALKLPHDDSCYTYKRRATIYSRLKQYDKAFSDIEKAIDQNPHDTSAVNWLLPSLGKARPRFRERLFGLADRVIEIIPDYGPAYQARGYLYGQFNQADKAMADFEKAIELNPDSKNAKLLNNAAWRVVSYSGMNQQRIDRALQWAEKAAELAPEKGNQWNTLGVALYRAGKWPEAIQALEKSEALSPQLYFSFNGFFLSMAHHQLGDKNTAHDWYKKSVVWMAKHMPDNVELIRFRAETKQLLEIPVSARKPGTHTKETVKKLNPCGEPVEPLNPK